MRAILFWDIDGTLLTTGRAGVYAWQDALAEILDRPVDPMDSLKTAGLTDHQIAKQILASLGEPHGKEEVERFVRRYEALLPASLPRRSGRVLEGIREALDFLRTNRPDIGLYLLTGNTRAGAQAKLTYYGLAQYFADGAFSRDAGDRPSIARAAMKLASRLGPVDANCTFVIGDTPHDITCGKAVGARTVAVASGEYSLEALMEHGPWKATDRIPGPEAFLDLLEIGALAARSDA